MLPKQQRFFYSWHVTLPGYHPKKKTCVKVKIGICFRDSTDRRRQTNGSFRNASDWVCLTSLTLWVKCNLKDNVTPCNTLIRQIKPSYIHISHIWKKLFVLLNSRLHSSSSQEHGLFDDTSILISFDIFTILEPLLEDLHLQAMLGGSRKPHKTFILKISGFSYLAGHSKHGLFCTMYKLKAWKQSSQSKKHKSRSLSLGDENIFKTFHLQSLYHFPFFLLPLFTLPLSCHCCWMAWSSLDLWHVEVPLARGPCESWPERDFAHPKLSRKKMPREREPPEASRRIDSFVVLSFSNVQICVLRNGRGMHASRAMKIESCKFTCWCESSCGSRTFDWYRISKQFRFLMLRQKHVTQTQESSINCIWMYLVVTSNLREDCPIWKNDASQLLTQKVRLSFLGPCRDPRSMRWQPPLFSLSGYHQSNDAAPQNPFMIPWSTEDMSISRLINT